MSRSTTNARRNRNVRPGRVWLAVAAGVAVWAAILVRLPGPAVTDPDGHASALYFDRLVHGQRLEQLVLSTPKPLLTLTHGIAWTLIHDWRAVTLLTVLAFAAAVTALARVAARLAGPPAAVAALVAVAGSGALLLQVARGNSVVWALAGWAVALDALAGRSRPRWALAAAALLAAGLSRTETWLLLPLVALLVAIAWRRGARASRWLLLAFAAPLLWFAHDYLLTGDPLWSTKIPVRYTDLIAGRTVIPPAAWAADVARRYAAQPALLAVAAAGVAWLATRRAWTVLSAACAIALGVLTLLGWYAAQGVYISWRYFDPPDLALRLLAAFGAAAVASTITRLAPRRRPPRPPLLAPSRPLPALALAPTFATPGPTSPAEGGRQGASLSGVISPDQDPPAGRPSTPPPPRLPTVAASLLAGLIAVAITWPVAPADPLVDSTLDRDTRLSANAAAAIEALRPFAAAGEPISVSGPQRVRVALALDRRLDQVHDLFVDTLHTPLDQALAGSRAVYHDADGDRPAERFAPLTRIASGQLGSLRLRPILTNPPAGLYVLSVEPTAPADTASPG